MDAAAQLPLSVSCLFPHLLNPHDTPVPSKASQRPGLASSPRCSLSASGPPGGWGGGQGPGRGAGGGLRSRLRRLTCSRATWQGLPVLLLLEATHRGSRRAGQRPDKALGLKVCPPPARVLLPGDARPTRMVRKQRCLLQAGPGPGHFCLRCPVGPGACPPSVLGLRCLIQQEEGASPAWVSCHWHSVGSDTIWHMCPLSRAVPACVLCPLWSLKQKRAPFACHAGVSHPSSRRGPGPVLLVLHRHLNLRGEGGKEGRGERRGVTGAGFRRSS